MFDFLGERPYKCGLCPKAFADKSNLRAHTQTHSSSKPFECRHCGKTFALKSYLYKHEEASCNTMKWMTLQNSDFLICFVYNPFTKWWQNKLVFLIHNSVVFIIKLLRVFLLESLQKYNDLRKIEANKHKMIWKCTQVDTIKSIFRYDTNRHMIHKE